MVETFEAYRTRVLSYLGDEEPIGVQQATPSQLESRLRDVAPEELIRRPAPEKWSIAEIVAHLADAELAMGWLVGHRWAPHRQDSLGLEFGMLRTSLPLALPVDRACGRTSRGVDRAILVRNHTGVMT